jgi:hypothetical protein
MPNLGHQHDGKQKSGVVAGQLFHYMKNIIWMNPMQLVHTEVRLSINMFAAKFKQLQSNAVIPCTFLLLAVIGFNAFCRVDRIYRYYNMKLSH